MGTLFFHINIIEGNGLIVFKTATRRQGKRVPFSAHRNKTIECDIVGSDNALTKMIIKGVGPQGRQAQQRVCWRGQDQQTRDDLERSWKFPKGSVCLFLGRMECPGMAFNQLGLTKSRSQRSGSAISRHGHGRGDFPPQ